MLPPAPLVKKIVRPSKRLDEDTYVESLSKIIERDYFPDLPILRYQNAYLEALNSGDNDRALKLQRKKFERMETPSSGNADYRAETPRLCNMSDESEEDLGSDYLSDDSMHSDDAADIGGGDYNVNMELRLDEFQSKYTSEDNESFYNILDKRNQRNRDKFAWIWNGNQMVGLRTIDYQQNQTLLDSENERSLIKMDDRPVKPASWKVSDPRNALLFKPEGLGMSKEMIESAKAKEILQTNTRISSDIWNESGTAVAESSDKLQYSATSFFSRSGTPSERGDETPKVRGFSFVSPAPSPESSFDGYTNSSSWSIGIDRTVSGASPFRMADTPKREELHHRLVAKQQLSARTRSQTPGGIPKFKSGPNIRRAMVTPAGQRLLSSIASRRQTTNVVEDSFRTSSEQSGRKATDRYGLYRHIATPVIRK
ncbi:nuclear protein DGCR14 [Dipodascopsis uninucleata]